ncbi:type IV secretion protein DotH [Gluconacetobacter aggeris]|uniref:Type IV secretion protein DotH n=1 Tax=Gluconacetobacter aggeris TaxID=1286186 RepID=A0A7W4IVW5_9PROT|nr:DotH/IcmK family type IV secretion protein [Gluconacetobacter aggeris]MBB2169938.1 type IV secretion protein DotH [Gluconacetobacter aggeris]
MRRLYGFVGGWLALAAVHSTALAQSQPEAQDRNPVDPAFRNLPPPPVMRGLYDRYDQAEKNLDGIDDPHRLAVPVSRSVTISLAPGAQTNIVRIAQDYPASITFLDETGQPWPIAWDLATNKGGGCDARGQGQNPAVRGVGIYACVPEAGSNVLQLTPISRYAHGGVLVSLKGAPKPINFMIMAGTGAYDADLTARVQGRGPNAKSVPVTEADAPVTGASFFNALLDGAPPADAVPLTVSGVSPDHTRAWKIGHEMFLRMDNGYWPVSPAPSAHQSEYDVEIFEIPETSVVLVSTGTRMISVSLSDDAP